MIFEAMEIFLTIVAIAALFLGGLATICGFNLNRHAEGDASAWLNGVERRKEPRLKI